MARVSSKVADIQPKTKTPDVGVANLAGRQHRVVDERQLNDLGLKAGRSDIA
jgi:hypothetical protein